MNVQLPPAFEERMKTLLEGEYEAFAQSYERPPLHGLRVNSLKIDPGRFLEMSPFSLTPIPWCRAGFYYPEGERPGKHPYHAAGLYYLQEPSAMSVAEVAEAEPGETVLDLCAAPGGKTTQLAAALRGEGLLVANEIHPARVKALSENVERLGIRNAVVTNETPEKLAERFPQYFDRIVVDAPCSGEGMFRKLPEALDDWSVDKVKECHLMQLDILESAARMLKPGGILVYSTCTFAPLENEQSIVQFLEHHPEFELIPLPHPEHFSPGVPEWAEPARKELTQTARLWPHRLAGEGHYVAKLRKSPDAEPMTPMSPRKEKRGKAGTPGRKEALAVWRAFADENLPAFAKRLQDEAAFLLFGEQLYYTPAPGVDWDGLKVVRTGLHLGTVKKNRFEPSHALALAVNPDDVLRTADFSSGDPDLLRYLRGESLYRDGSSGWTLFTVDGFSLGWGKQSDGQLKNHYPKGLRWV
jgi:NOL1/NOP2/sun family putative RNA methylase